MKEYEVWSILGALEVPYTPQKNYTYQNHIWTATFVTRKFFVRPTLLSIVVDVDGVFTKMNTIFFSSLT